MKNILLAGATGHTGRAIATELHRRGLPFTALVRNSSRAALLRGLTDSFRYAEATDPNAFTGISTGHEVVISALGKSVSPFDRSKPTFDQVDLAANRALINDAAQQGVRKFVYVSAFGAQKHPGLRYFRVHQQVEEQLKTSGLDWSIVRPPALFSAFTDLLTMARKGRLMHLGAGDRQTNPIWEGDLARIVADSIDTPSFECDPGGPEVLTRRAINELIQRVAAPHKKIRQAPLGLIKALLPLVKLTDRNSYDKLAFFTEVYGADNIATPVGSKRLEQYLREQAAGAGR
ncbi:SDR family oxidoreductase [Flaviaesturariibacter amylovorans]|uniref:SDR family oxidoreductase n=1 Tax=Flaviaesturariibacter amylovorans TaxID=1084520 RepID=A0ABP8GIM2_9BACT